MRKAFSLFVAASIFLLFSCSTSGDDSMRPVDRTISLIETLASAEEAPLVQLPAEGVDAPAENVQAEVPEPAEESEAEPEIPEPAESLPAAVTDDAADDAGVQAAAEETAPAEIIPEPIDEATEAAPEAESEPVPAEEELLPAEPEPILAEPEPMPAEPEPAAETDSAPASVPSESTDAEPMDSWMMELMVVLVVIIILFTGACAIRNAYRAPLPRLIAAAISILVTALAWVLSLVIAGPSEVYPVYLILLTVYIVLRSKGRS